MTPDNSIDASQCADDPHHEQSGVPMDERTIVLWVPDFPLYAARCDNEVPDGPLALVDQHGVYVCDRQARHVGVRRGMKRRQAQSLCPTMHIMPVADDRDARYFEDFVADVDSISAGIELLRPGLIAVKSAPLVKYYGSEERAITMVLDAVARPGVDVIAGAAGTLPTAVFAARRGMTIPEGHDADFLAGLPVRTLCEDKALGQPQELVDTLEKMGITRMKDWAGLSRRDVSSRFGAEGLWWWSIARGAPSRRLTPQENTSDLAITHHCDSPESRSDTVAFIGRRLAADLHDQLSDRGQICLRVAIRALIRTPDGDQELERVWRCTDQLTEHAIAQRVRWQLEGWLHRFVSRAAATVGQSDHESGASDNAGVPDSVEVDATPVGVGVCELTLDPIETTSSSMRGLWGAKEDHAAHAALARVQTMLGPDRICTPVLKGGRGPEDRIALVPVGESAPNLPSSTYAWPGQFPAPIPVTKRVERGPSAAHPASGVSLLDEDGHDIIVTGRSLLSAQPACVAWGTKRYDITGWSGPWPVDEQWWAQGRRFARLQVTTNQPSGLLLICRGKKWRIEGVYR